MPYEVVKRVNGRDYRYSVERYRDQETGKARARWTYLGRAGAGVPRKRSRTDSTRDRLVDALFTLIEEVPWNAITVDLIVKRASAAELRRTAIEGGMVSLRRDGLRKVAEGISTLEEVRVVTQMDVG